MSSAVKTKTDWQCLLDEGRNASEQMAFDEALALKADPTVRVFFWQKPAISLGRNQPQPNWLEEKDWVSGGFESVERPTGGGMAFHGSDVSLSVVISRQIRIPLATLMQVVCESVRSLCDQYEIDVQILRDVEGERSQMFYCLTETHSPYSCLINGRKVAGFALRRFPESWLIQGSLLINPIPKALQLALPQWLVKDIAHRATPLSEVVGKLIDPHEVGQSWIKHWSAWWEESLLREFV